MKSRSIGFTSRENSEEDIHLGKPVKVCIYGGINLMGYIEKRDGGITSLRPTMLY